MLKSRFIIQFEQMFYVEEKLASSMEESRQSVVLACCRDML